MIEHTKIFCDMDLADLETDIDTWETLNQDVLQSCRVIQYNHKHSLAGWLNNTNFQAVIGYTLKKGPDDLSLIY